MTVSALKGHCTTHAEVSAVKSCRGSVEGATIYVARVSRDGQRQMMSKPCKACQKYLKEVGIKKIYYTIDSEMELQ